MCVSIIVPYGTARAQNSHADYGRFVFRHRPIGNVKDGKVDAGLFGTPCALQAASQEKACDLIVTLTLDSIS